MKRQNHKRGKKVKSIQKCPLSPKSGAQMVFSFETVQSSFCQLEKKQRKNKNNDNSIHFQFALYLTIYFSFTENGALFFLTTYQTPSGLTILRKRRLSISLQLKFSDRCSVSKKVSLISIEDS